MYADDLTLVYHCKGTISVVNNMFLCSQHLILNNLFHSCFYRNIGFSYKVYLSIDGVSIAARNVIRYLGLFDSNTINFFEAVIFRLMFGLTLL